MKKRYACVLGAVALGTAMMGTMLWGCSAQPEKGGVSSMGQSQEGQSQADHTQEGKDQSPLREVTFALDWTPNTNHTGIYVAQEKGYFKEEGLEVKIVQPPENGAEVLTASGKADMAISFQDSLALAFSGDNQLPVTAVAAVIQHNTSGIISRKGEGIDRPKGLEGKKYATWDLPIEKATIQEVMEEDGGDFSKVKLIPSTVTDEVTALKTKSVDAIWIFYGWAGIKTELEGLDTDYFAFADLNPVFDFYTPVIIAGNDFLEREPDTARAFLKAVSRGYEDAIKNPEEGAHILCKAAPELDPELVRASQQYLADQYQADARKWGYMSGERWNAYFNWLNEKGLVETPIEENTGFSNDYLP